MSDERTIATLNRLLDAEYVSFIPRLEEACPFVSASQASNLSIAVDIVKAAQSRRRGLVQMILELGGSPVPPRRNADTASIHYVDLAYLMPNIVAAQRELMEAYTAAGRTGCSEADAFITRSLVEHHHCLAELEARSRSS